MEIFKDNNRKDSMKRILGALGVVTALVLSTIKPFIESGNIWSDTLLIGILTTSFASIVMGVFEKKITRGSVGGEIPPDDDE